MKKVLVTSDFCSGCKKLVNSNSTETLNNLRTVLIKLVNEWEIPSKYRDPQLKNSPYRELHISGDDLLLYRYGKESDSITLDLKLSDITNHKGLRTRSNQDQHDYFEVSNQFLNDITSATSSMLSKLDRELLNDLLESISDYSSTYLDNGYILLGSYYLQCKSLYCLFEYYLYSTDQLADSIYFVVDLAKYAPNAIAELDYYVDDFSREVADAFAAIDEENAT